MRVVQTCQPKRSLPPSGGSGEGANGLVTVEKSIDTTTSSGALYDLKSKYLTTARQQYCIEQQRLRQWALDVRRCSGEVDNRSSSLFDELVVLGGRRSQNLVSGPVLVLDDLLTAAAL
jgi:hypothetical protein